MRESSAFMGYQKNTTSYDVEVFKKLVSIKLEQVGEPAEKKKAWMWAYDLVLGDNRSYAIYNKYQYRYVDAENTQGNVWTAIIAVSKYYKDFSAEIQWSIK